MDAMEDMDLLSGSNTHLSKLSSECNIMGGASQLKTTITAGLKYRHIGKTGLKVSNVALGMPCLIRYEMTNIPYLPKKSFYTYYTIIGSINNLLFVSVCP